MKKRCFVENTVLCAQKEESSMLPWIVFLAVDDGPGFLPCLFAYLDPGSGSMLFQILIAGLLSALFCCRCTLLELKSALFGRREKG